MNLSFMSLPVIPDMRITTLGVFDVLNWKLVK
jgi:adenine deaminase